jgi:ADP-glucose pyrophosphorylase
MLSQNRFRLLIEHHELHKDLYNEANLKIPIFMNLIQEQRQALEETIAKEQALTPIIQEVKRKDLKEFEELNIVSKHRYISYEKKKKDLFHKWEMEKQAEHDRKEDAKQKIIRMNEFVDSKSEKMKAFLKESTEKVLL